MLNKVDECASDEWCAGAETFDEGFDTPNYKSLCVKGIQFQRLSDHYGCFLFM